MLRNPISWVLNLSKSVCFYSCLAFFVCLKLEERSNFQWCLGFLLRHEAKFSFILFKSKQHSYKPQRRQKWWKIMCTCETYIKIYLQDVFPCYTAWEFKVCAMLLQIESLGAEKWKYLRDKKQYNEREKQKKTFLVCMKRSTYLLLHQRDFFIFIYKIFIFILFGSRLKTRSS